MASTAIRERRRTLRYRNLNTGEEQARATRMIKATNVIYHDKAHPSALVVPVVP